jgi:transposase
MPRRERRSYSAEFKSQIVQLYQNGKRKSDIIKDYDLASSLLDRWIKQATTTGSFKEKDNRSEIENQLIELQKKNKRLLMENDILKQAALIMGRK